MQIIIKSLVNRNKSVYCCTKDGNLLNPRDVNDLCIPVRIPNEYSNPDPFYYYLKNTGLSFHCMNYVRSAPAVRSDCTFGSKEQVRAINENSITINVYLYVVVIFDTPICFEN